MVVSELGQAGLLGGFIRVFGQPNLNQLRPSNHLRLVYVYVVFFQMGCMSTIGSFERHA